MRLVADRTDSVTLTKAADTLIDLPLRILFVIVVAIVMARIGRRVVTRMVRRVAGGSVQGLNALERPGSRRSKRSKTDPAEQWIVGRELRLRIKEALDVAGIDMAITPRTIWLRHTDEPLNRGDLSIGLTGFSQSQRVEWLAWSL